MPGTGKLPPVVQAAQGDLIGDSENRGSEIKRPI
jgi:hypothetical protein